MFCKQPTRVSYFETLWLMNHKQLVRTNTVQSLGEVGLPAVSTVCFLYCVPSAKGREENSILDCKQNTMSAGWDLTSAWIKVVIKETLNYPFSALILIFLESSPNKSQGAKRPRATDQNSSNSLPYPALFALGPARASSPKQLLHCDANRNAVTRRHKKNHVETAYYK